MEDMDASTQGHGQALILDLWKCVEPLRISNPERTQFLSQFYRVPDPMNTWEDWERYAHHDLPRMTGPQLLDERERISWRLRLDECPPPWLIERLARVSEAIDD